MTRAGIYAVAGLCACWLTAERAGAVTEYVWNSALTGTQDWPVDGNWDLAGFPDGPMDVANLSVPLANDLTIRLGSEDVTIAGLALGGTAGAVTTQVSSLGGRLLVQNDDVTFNNGNALFTSVGAPGSVNRINASVRLAGEALEFSAASTNDAVLAGQLSYSGATASLRSFMPAGRKAHVTGLINMFDPADPDNYRDFRLNDNAGSPDGMDTVSTQGTLEISGEIFGYSQLSIGVTTGTHPVPLGTVILSGNNTYIGNTQLNRANLVLANDYALSDYALFTGNPNQGVGFNLISDDDNRTLANYLELSQWLTMKGEHSLHWAGPVVQSNTRGWVNLLPDGKQLTLSGGQFAVYDEDTERTYSFDGTGRTVVTGGLHDKWVDGVGQVDDGSIGHYRKTGTGVVVVSEVMSDYHGNTLIEAGNLHFQTGGRLANSAAIVSTGGAIGVDDPVNPTFSSATLLGKVDAPTRAA